MAKPILVANWKNHPNSLAEAQALMKELSKKKLLYKKTKLFIASPLPYFETVASRGKSFSSLASQDISIVPNGTWTSVVTPEIIKSFGVQLTLVGHSERRTLGETTEEIREKIKTALRSGITPLICFGEKDRDKDGEHLETLRQELKFLLTGVSKKEVGNIALAYEPAWAIGKHAWEAIDPAELSQTIVFIKKALADLFGREIADRVPILYGGSVEPANARELMTSSGVRGFLVGHASLKAKSFESIALSLTTK